MKHPQCNDHPYAGYILEHPWGRCVCPKCGKFIGLVDPIDGALMVRPACSICGQTDSVHLMRTIQINGNSLIYWHCQSCDRFASQPLPHFRVKTHLECLRYRYPEISHIASDIEEIPTKYDYRDGEPCVICGSHDGTEYNHFMPQAFRYDPDIAPYWTQWERCGVQMCRNCHEKWHGKVAPMMLLAGAGNGGSNHA